MASNRKVNMVKGDIESTGVAKKIVMYSRTDPTGEKLLRYLQYVTFLKKKFTGTGSQSPWKELKTQGALEGIMLSLKKLFVSEDVAKLTNVDEQANKKGANQNQNSTVKDICSVSLSVLSHSFALDYSIRSEAVKNGFISSLQQFIANFTKDTFIVFKHAEMLSRAVRCIANLSNDSHCRESVLRTGVAISILRILELVDEKMNSDTFKDATSGQSFVDKVVNKNLICSCIRAIRILTSDSKLTSNGRSHLLRFGSLVTVINTLTWDGNLSSDETFVLDVVRALNFLSVRIRSAPPDVVDTLIYNPEVCKIRRLIKIFEGSQPDGKLFTPVIKCLINFSANKEISDCIGSLRIFPIILEKLDVLNENYYHDLIKLLIALTRFSSFNHSHLTTSPLIGSTLKILKSSRFKEYHEWLLMVYEKLYDVSLKKLIQCDLVSYLCDILRQDLEDCDYEALRRKISSIDDARCSVHKNSYLCPFAPLYRCSSPSYQKIQEEMKTKASYATIDSALYNKRGEDSLSPFSSPAHSWSSGRSSPGCSSESNFISYSSVSEDEGCYSPPKQFEAIDSSSPERNSVSDEDVDSSGSREAANNVYEPALKKLKLEDGTSEITDQQKERCFEAIKSSAKRILGVLNIMYKCAYITPFPENMLQIIPVILGILLRGKMSLVPQGIEYRREQNDEEFHETSRRTFEVSYKIVLKMCSTSQIFPEIIISGIIPILHRLQEPMSVTKGNEELMAVVQRYCANLIRAMTGCENDTYGWREGYIMRYLLTKDSSDKMDQMTVNIPLLYQKHSSTLRKFEMKAKSWSKILEMLINSDDVTFYRFEDCTLALCSICVALGIKWTPHDPEHRLPMLSHPPSNLHKDVVISSSDSTNATEPSSNHEENRVKLILDDGTIFTVEKDLLLESSPVFTAMFNGHFIESGQQQVLLPGVSKGAVTLLLDQIFMQRQANKLPNGVANGAISQQYDLATIFELFRLADRFLLEDVYERALNTLMTKCICPNSAPIIYAESVRLVTLRKSESSQMMGLSSYILMYVLTAENIRMPERCNAVRKIFDSVVPTHVVEDLKALIEFHMYKN